jgi:hypothetical protein
MSNMEGLNATLDPVAVSLRTFNIRLSSIERLFAAQTRQAAEPGPKGDKGDKGDRGPKGDTGPMGPMAIHEWNSEHTRIRFTQGPDGVNWGEWSEDLKGPKGDGATAGAIDIAALARVVASEITINSWMPSGW